MSDHERSIIDKAAYARGYAAATEKIASDVETWIDGHLLPGTTINEMLATIAYAIRNRSVTEFSDRNEPC